MTALSSRERLGPTNTFSREEISIGKGLSTGPRSTTFSGSNSPHDNVSDLFVTPAAPVRWCKLLGEAEPNKFEPSKPATWSCELILDPKDTEHMAWMQQAEQHFVEAHGDNAKRSNHWLSIAKDKDDPEKACAKFKIPCFIRKDLTKSPGPTVMDAGKQPWNPNTLIGNGSTVRIAYTVYGWSGPSGAGITMQPVYCQVLNLVEYAREGAAEADPFSVVASGYKQPAADAECPMPEPVPEPAAEECKLPF